MYTDSSRNGTWYVRAGEREPTATLRQGSDIEEHEMSPGDNIMLGHTTIEVVSVEAAGAADGGDGAKAVPRRMRRSSDMEAEALFSHPFSQLLAAGPPSDAEPFFVSHSMGAMSDDALGSLGRRALSHV